MKKIVLITLIIALSFLVVGCNPYPNVVNTPEDVEGKLIGALHGTPSLRLADELGTAKAFFEASDMMADLRAGGVDCVIMERTTAIELVTSTRGVRILLEPLVEYDLRFAIPLENRGLLNAVNRAIDELGRNGTLRGLTNRYFSRGRFNYRSPDNIDRTGTLTIALSSDSPPFSYKDDEGNFVGMDVDVAIAVSDILGVHLEPVEFDAWDLVTAVWHGRADLALGWHPGEGEGLVRMSEPYASAIHVVIVRR